MSTEIAHIPYHEPRYQKVIQDNILAILGKKPISEQPEPVAKTALLAAVTDSYLATNSRGAEIKEENEEHKLDETVQMLYRDCLSFYPGRSIEEICYAIRLGCRGALGDYHGLSVKTYNHFIKTYFSMAARVNAVAENHKRIKLLREEAERKLAELTPEQIRENSIKTAVVCFDLFKSSGLVQDWGNVTYDFLDKEGLIPFTVEEKKEMYSRAERQVLSEQLNETTVLSKIVQLRDALRAIHEGETHGHKLSPSRLKATAKRIALGVLFYEWKKEGKSVEQILKTENLKG